MKYVTQGIQQLPLETRLEHLKNLRTIDQRSIEARIRSTALCPLKQFFQNDDDLYRFTDELKYCADISLSPEDTYSEAASHIYFIFKDGYITQGVNLLLFFLLPVWNAQKKYSTHSFHELSKHPDSRRFLIPLKDYNCVLDKMYPDLAADRIPPFYTVNLSSTHLTYIARQELSRLIEYMRKVRKASKELGKDEETDWKHLENNPKIISENFSLDPKAIKESYTLLKQIFIDPYFYLWAEEQNQPITNDFTTKNNKTTASDNGKFRFL